MTKPLQTLYKLTDGNSTTRGNSYYGNGRTQWGENVTNRAIGDWRQPLCTDGWIHAYEHPLLAAFLHPIHVQFDDPILWEARGRVGKRDGLKCGCRALTTVKKIDLPKPTREQCVRFAILCAKEVYTDKVWLKWADGWLSGKDRSPAAARKERKRLDTGRLYLDELFAAITAAEAPTTSRNVESAAARTARNAIAAKKGIDLVAIAKAALKPAAKPRRSSARKRKPAKP